MNFDKLPDEIKDLVQDLYRDGLLNDNLHTILIDNKELFIVPDQYPEMTGEFIEEGLSNLYLLDEFRKYLHDHDESPLIEDWCEMQLQEFNPVAYEILRERFVDGYLEGYFQTISKNFFKR